MRRLSKRFALHGGALVLAAALLCSGQVQAQNRTLRPAQKSLKQPPAQLRPPGSNNQPGLAKDGLLAPRGSASLSPGDGFGLGSFPSLSGRGQPTIAGPSGYPGLNPYGGGYPYGSPSPYNGTFGPNPGFNPYGGLSPYGGFGPYGAYNPYAGFSPYAGFAPYGGLPVSTPFPAYNGFGPYSPLSPTPFLPYGGFNPYPGGNPGLFPGGMGPGVPGMPLGL